MAKAMVIVESPAKVKTINKILGTKYKVVSSMGHLVDLPISKFGIDVEDNFKPHLIVMRKKQKVLTQLKKEAKTKTEIYVATDPDREGEAIGWNIITHIGEGKKIYRIAFHEITKEAVLKALKNPREFDLKKVDAQIARRILDRIVGYQLSPLLWKKIGSYHLSAGRVQSVALRLIVEREREILSFKPEEYWQIAVDLKKTDYKEALTAALEKIDDKKYELKTESEAGDIVAQIKKENFSVSNVTAREVKRNPAPPFITSTLQQEAFNKLGFNTAKTMIIAQQLYEGIELGGKETVGLITYMRTDSVNIANEAVDKVRDLIGKSYGKKYLPEKPNVYKSKKSAQEAHEAIRPSDVMRRPEDVKEYLDGDQFELYELIWRRFVACQMMPAVFSQKKIEIKAGRFQFGASGSTIVFDGYLTVYRQGDEAEEPIDLSHYRIDDPLVLVDVKPSQHFTKPPARYSEATLVRALEEDGIGRPSTYSPIVQTLVLRHYVNRERGYFRATELGMLICDLLMEYFPKIMDIGFTATMEEHLDLVEEGKLEYPQLLKEFYQPFKEELDYAMLHIEKTQVLTDKICPQCGKPLAIKWGRRGKFLSCSAFPACKYAQSFLTGVKCPQEGCGGELVERRSRRGAFFGCSNYPKCTFVASKLPEVKPSTQPPA
ncbi:MAG TPA: type I DNA topoisomerase [Candidatus Omnitrophota bacterium]|nr:type I DNA topoisomerase [Candidatus Omnitrophota bacterium]HPD84972.1 type I DNA topoisomerase [Candidatus Omnitrophota bacterium]HRZ03830.1 type I DNA topoisomerase [Candidatus Omnitrophota bacterium]